MEKRYLTAVIKEKRKIIGAKINGEEFSIDDVFKHINNKDEGWNYVYAYCEGYPISKVFTKTNFWGTQFLTTVPDGILENNLNELEEF